MKKLVLLVSFLLVVLAFSIPASAIESNVDSEVTQDMAADQRTEKADKKAFKGQFADELERLEALRAVCKTNQEKIKALNDSIKSAQDGVKELLKSMDRAEAKEIKAEIKSQIEPLKTQVKAIHDAAASLRDQKKNEWVNFRAAVEEKNLAKAAAAINNILTLKQQIIDKQNEMIPLKESILGVFNSYK